MNFLLPKPCFWFELGLLMKSKKYSGEPIMNLPVYHLDWLSTKYKSWLANNMDESGKVHFYHNCFVHVQI